MSRSDDSAPRLATSKEFPEVLDLVDRCFNAEPGGMRASNPHCYDRDRPERHAVIERDGRIVSHAACIPDDLVCGANATVPCWGLSGVATDPRYAGEGYMGELLEFWIDRTTADGVPILRLWGDRARYGRFGFETVGRERHFRITERSFRNPPDRDEHVRRYDGDVDTVSALYERLPYRVSRTREDHRRLLDQRGLEVLLYRDGSGDEAYVAFTSDGRERTVTEVAGDPRGVTGLIAHLFRAYYTDEVRVLVHPNDPVSDVVRPISVDWIDRTHKQLRVNRLDGVAEALESQIDRRFPTGKPGEATIGIEGEAESIRIQWDASGEIRCRAVEGEATVELPRRELARALFDECDTGIDGPPDGLLESALPLELFVPRTNWV